MSRSATDGSDWRVPKLLALLMICVLMLSHGTASASMPHVGAVYADSHGHDHESPTAHQVDDHRVPVTQDGDGDERVGELDIVHVHQQVDIAPLTGMTQRVVRIRALPGLPQRVARLASRRSPPLLQPPSA